MNTYHRSIVCMIVFLYNFYSYYAKSTAPYYASLPTQYTIPPSLSIRLLSPKIARVHH